MTSPTSQWREAANRLGVSERRVRKLARDGRVRGALKTGAEWLIPTPVEVIPGKTRARGRCLPRRYGRAPRNRSMTTPVNPQSSMNWDIPRISDDPLPLSLQSGDRLFIVGPNGSGKSALIQHLVSGHQGRNIRRISAHRQTWLDSGSLNLHSAWPEAI